MEPIYRQEFQINDAAVDCYGRLKPSTLLYYIQEVAGIHGAALGADSDTLAQRNLIWAILRSKVQVTRLPHRGETIRLETWPMPTTRVAYPRSVVAYDSTGREIFRAISLWVMMDATTRSMVIPSKSGFFFEGTLTGSELAVPGSIIPRTMTNSMRRTVRFTDLDQNCHMNNTRYFDWICDLLPSSFHRDRHLKELTICYLSEAREGQTLDMHWDIGADSTFQVEGHRLEADGSENRVFAAKMLYD